MNPKELKGLISKIEEKDVLSVKNELLLLFGNEVYERNLYFQELRRFEGEIFETVKWLSEQEGTHALILQMILARGNIMTKEDIKPIKIISDKIKIIKMDIENERVAVQNYENAINKSSGALKEALTKIMEEEFEHIKRLQEYLRNN